MKVGFVSRGSATAPKRYSIARAISFCSDPPVFRTQSLAQLTHLVSSNAHSQVFPTSSDNLSFPNTSALSYDQYSETSLALGFASGSRSTTSNAATKRQRMRNRSKSLNHVSSITTPVGSRRQMGGHSASIASF